ncbi:MAG: hypothetical protein C0621_05510, partial [Desulfuromonas sp.]
MLFCCLLLGVMFILQASTAAIAGDTGSSVSVLVKFVAGTSPAEQTNVIADHGGTETGAIGPLRLRIVAVPVETLELTLADYSNDPLVERVELDQRRKVDGVPVDIDYSLQWALVKIGWEDVYGIVAPTGTAIVALLDTGVNSTHEDLAGKVLAGASTLDNGSGQTDPNGHGTAMAGIIAAVTGNDAGIAGVAFDGVQILPVTVLDVDGFGQDSDVIAGLLYAVEQHADVIVMAFSNPGQSQSLQEAIDYAWAQGAVLVAAAGNSASSEPAYPAGSPCVMGVSSTDQDDELDYASNFGQAIFLGAPGVNLYTTRVDGTYGDFSGTSAAAAVVGGAAGFLKAVDPSLTNGQIVGRLARSADPAGTVEETGNGRVNLARALADTGTEPIQPAGAPGGGPFVGPYVAANKSMTITFAGSGGGSISFSGVTPDPQPTVNPCTGTCSNTLNNNAVGTLTVSANSGSIFTGWIRPVSSSATTNCSDETSPCTFSLGNSTLDLTATFDLDSCPDADGDGVCDDVYISPGGDDTIDGDSDGVPDACDNCPADANAGQVDADGDGYGDVCDICPGANDAVDSDSDGVPDGCDVCAGFDDAADADGDGVPNGCDICAGFDDAIDTDGDGVPDGCDNCVSISNPGQVDADGDDYGAACDCNDSNASVHPGAIEIIGDGIDSNCDGTELCYVDADDDGFRLEMTVSSADMDCIDSGEATAADPTGDCNDSNAAVHPGATELCDGLDNNCDGTTDEGFPDSDNDLIADCVDSCPNDVDNDIDGDGICGDVDNCPAVANPDQADSDGDGYGDACDICSGGDDAIDGDSDGVPDACDNCPADANAGQADADGDGIGDVCDICPGGDDSADSDGDGVPNACDACPGHDDFADADGDSVPDGCDVCPGGDDFADADADGVPNSCDNCLSTSNPDQADSDGDGYGDACDICSGGDDAIDGDSDGVPDACDNCPADANAG